MIDATRALDGMQSVSMKSGLEGRNNVFVLSWPPWP